MTNNTRTSSLIISSILLLAVIVRLICFVGLIGSDDLNYNRGAYSITTGTFSAQLDHQRTRIGLLLPVAGTFKVFGVHEWSSIAFSFFYFIMTFGLLIYTVTICFGKWPGIIAGLLYTFLPIEIFNATMLLPDLPSAACLALSGTLVYLITENFENAGSHHAKDSGQAFIKTYGYMFLGGFALGWAYLIKETSLFFGVFVAGYMAYRALRRRTIQWAWLWYWLGVFTIIGVEMGYYYWIFGNPLYRYLSIETSVHAPGATELWRKHSQEISLLKYLTVDRLRILFDISEFGFYYFFVFAGVIYGLLKRIKAVWYFIGWFLTLFFLNNFVSKSLSAYIPLRTIPRYFIMLSFPAAIIIAWYIYEMRYFLQKEHRKDLGLFRISLFIPCILLCIVNALWFSVITTLFLLFIVLLLLISYSDTLRTWFRNRIPSKYTTLILPCILLYVSLLPGIYMTAKGERPRTGITCERNIRPLLEYPLTHTIYTDSRTENILEYYYEYQYDNRIKNFDELDVETWENAYVVVNWGRLFFLNRLYNTPIPEFLYYPPQYWKPYARIDGKTNPCLIYEIH